MFSEIYVVYGVDTTHYYPSGDAEVHYAGTDKEMAMHTYLEAKEKNDADWFLIFEVWENGKKKTVLQVAE